MMDAQYFINRFEAIPEEKWCTSTLDNGNGQKCANGHLGVNDIGEGTFNETRESVAVWELFREVRLHNHMGYSISDYPWGIYSSKLAAINNGRAVEYQQDTPKQRVLAALRDLANRPEEDKAADEAVNAVNEILSRPTPVNIKLQIAEVPKLELVSIAGVIAGLFSMLIT